MNFIGLRRAAWQRLAATAGICFITAVLTLTTGTLSAFAKAPNNAIAELISSLRAKATQRAGTRSHQGKLRHTSTFIKNVPGPAGKTPFTHKTFTRRAISNRNNGTRLAVGGPVPRTPVLVNSKRTRFVIGLPKAGGFQVSSLTNPNRVVVDLPTIRVALPRSPGAKPIGLIKSFRVGRSAPGRSRIVINVTAPVIVANAKLHKSATSGTHQLVLDIVPVSETTKARRNRKAPPRWLSASAASLSRLGAGRLQPPVPQRALSPAKRRARIYKPVIVLDPGHGGHDTGATRNGTVESRVVLAFAKTLRDRLRATGRYRVLMTRDKDVFIPLSDRVKFAEDHNAALFIAIHADYARSSASGATIYSLRERTARRLRRDNGRVNPDEVLTRKEQREIRKKAGGGDVSFVKNILADLASRERKVTYERTNVFTRSVVAYMKKSTTMRAKPHRTAGFRVLKTAKVPSVLIELAYVTNRRDARKLKSKSWRRKVSESITIAVDNYFGSQIAQLPM